MPQASDAWVLIFSDGTGQRGVRAEAINQIGARQVKSTNVFEMYSAIDGKQGVKAFYDAGLGAPEQGEWDWARTLRNAWSKATGWGITANIVDCYEALMIDWQPGMKIGLFGFSRGAYTVRCVGGVLAVCGIASTDEGAPISKDKGGPGAKRRRAIAEEAVKAYKIRDDTERPKAGAVFRARHGAADVVPDVIGVFDTVRALGLPGIMNVANPFRHEFHDRELSTRVPVGLHALSIDENRKSFAAVAWEESGSGARASGQVIEQCWFPGVHSDIGGGYDDDDNLAKLSLGWMLERLRTLCGLHFPINIDLDGKVLGLAHDERKGRGIFWLPADRLIQAKAIDADRLCFDIEKRFDDYRPVYRPRPLRWHPRVKHRF